MILRPQKTRYDVGDILEIRCNGDLGNQNIDYNTPNNNWRWQWKSIDSITSWTTYPHMKNITSTVTGGQSSTSCQIQASSTLIHYITKLDNGRQFRCSAFSGYSINANSTIYLASTGTSSFDRDLSILVKGLLAPEISTFSWICFLICTSTSLYLLWYMYSYSFYLLGFTLVQS
jgi:hypothetical protein